MKLLSALAILLLIASCGHNHLRLVKAGPRKIVKTEQTVVVENIKEDKNIEVAAQLVKKPDVINSETVIVEENNRIISESDVNENNVGTTEDDDEDDDEKSKFSQTEYDSAVAAERHARTSKNLLIGAIPLVFLPVIGWISSLVLFCIGAFLYHKAKNARYITERGQRYENTARTLFIGYSVMLAVVALLFLTTVLIILFF